MWCFSLCFLLLTIRTPHSGLPGNDPQNDFHPGGSLAIPTADGDSSRIADLIRRKIHEIDEIVVTLDSHQRIHAQCLSHNLVFAQIQKDLFLF